MIDKVKKLIHIKGNSKKQQQDEYINLSLSLGIMDIDKATIKMNEND
jgi:hypothetical protein